MKNIYFSESSIKSRQNNENSTPLSLSWKARGKACLITVVLIAALPGCISAQARREQLQMAQQQEAQRKAEETRQRRAAEEQRKQEAYAQWFYSLSREQQVQVTVEKERTHRAQQQQQADMMNAIIEGVGNAMAPDVYVIER
jgi:hypothetical protein